MLILFVGDVYWNECGRDFIVDPNQPKENFKPENMANLVYRSLKPLRYVLYVSWQLLSYPIT